MTELARVRLRNELPSLPAGGGSIRDRICPIIPGRKWWQGLTLGCVQFQRFFHNATKFRKHGLLVGAVAASVKQSRTTSYETIILIGPFNEFHIFRCSIHDLDSPIARLTARS